MNGEIPSVPITTLAGIASLTDLLPELPLPSPLPSSVAHKSLLFHPRVAEEARRLLNLRDEPLANQLVNALSQTSIDHIELKDSYAGSDCLEGELPELLKAILQRNPNTLKSVRFPGLNSRQQMPPTATTVTTFYPPHASNFTQHSPYPSPHLSPYQSQTSPSRYTPQDSPARYQPQGSPVVELKSRSASQLNGSAAASMTTTLIPTTSPTSNLLPTSISAASTPFTISAPTPSPISIPTLSPISNLTPISNPTSATSSASTPIPNSVSFVPAIPKQEPMSPLAPSRSKTLSNSPAHTPQLTPSPVQHTQASVEVDRKPVLPPPQQITRRKSSFSEPVVVLNKLTKEMIPNAAYHRTHDEHSDSFHGGICMSFSTPLQEQALAQKSVREFSLKTPVQATGPVSGNCKPRTPPRSRQQSTSSDRSGRYTIDSDSDSSSDNVPLSEKTRKEKDRFREMASKAKGKPPAKRQRSSDDKPFVVENSFDSHVDAAVSSLTDRVKRRKRGSTQASYAESPDETVNEEKPPSPKKELPPPSPSPVSLQKRKLQKEKVRKKMVIPEENLTLDELMDTNTFKKFTSGLEVIFESSEDLDFTADLEEDAEVPPEALIPKYQLSQLCTEAAKLKNLGAMEQIPADRLVRLLNILERNIRDGAKLLPIQNQDEHDEEEGKLWLELTMERVTRSIEASLTALYIMTSRNMPKQVYLEDVIERVISFAKYQLQNTIFPVFDPVYRVDSKNKDGYVGNIKQKRARAKEVKQRTVLQLYNKLKELVALLAELLNIQRMTDTTVLQVSTLGVSPFFVENVSELQLSTLRLVTSVFSKYEKHRQLILEDILASLARLPTSKRSLRNYRLNSEEQIQMVTALILQLIQCVVQLPKIVDEVVVERPPSPTADKKPKAKVENEKKNEKVDNDVLIVTSYETAMRTALNFLSVFLKKCSNKGDELDYRPLFENFVQDLLTTVNKPEWPAAELLLSLLGRLLVQNFSNKSLDMSLRVASLDYLGAVAARLRKDAVSSQLKQDTINELIKQVTSETGDDDSFHRNSKNKKYKNHEPTDRTQVLQKALLDYLCSHLQSDPALQFAKQFYIAQWYRDANKEALPEKKESSKGKDLDKRTRLDSPRERHGSGRIPCKSSKGVKKKRRKIESSSEEEEEDELVDSEDELHNSNSQVPISKDREEQMAEILRMAEKRKKFLLFTIKADSNRSSTLISNQKQCKIDYESAELITRFLASKRPFSQSFDIYLSQILRVLNESAIAVRTKAMKCLALVVEADPGILARSDMQRGVHGRFLDHSTSVREAAVDLVGKFILIRPELTNQYYSMLIERILDTGVSVRKRVIKILKDVCIEQPEFSKIPEICVKMIRRVNDEEGIKKLVNEVFQNMWFSPVKERDIKNLLLRKVMNITEVVSACKESGLDWFEQLLQNLLKHKEKEDNSHIRQVLLSCRQIVDCLVENVLQIEENALSLSDGGGIATSQRLVSCLTTLYLFAKIKPDFLVPHATTLQPYLSVKCTTQGDCLVLHNVARTLELVVPLMEHPSETFLAQLEENMIKLILRHGQTVVESCISCLGSVVNNVTHNYKLVKDCFQKFFVVLQKLKGDHEHNPDKPELKMHHPALKRSLFTVGLFCRHFDFDTQDTTREPSQMTIKEKLLDCLLYFLKHQDDEVKNMAITGLGSMCIRHYELMLGREVKAIYSSLLTEVDASIPLKCQVLKNIQTYLQEEEIRMIKQDSEWSKMSKKEDLKEMGDITSGMASTVIQIYLKEILESFLHGSTMVRTSVLGVIQLILSQGLVHPVQIVPYLICMSTDTEQTVRTKADQQLQEIEKKYPGFIQMKAIAGVKMSYRLQQIIEQGSEDPVRGYRLSATQGEPPSGLNGYLYAVVRGSRQHRRAFILCLLKQFDEQVKTPLNELLYLADNLAYFPYQMQEEPLFLIHHIDVFISVTGSNLLQSFREMTSPLKAVIQPVAPELGQFGLDLQNSVGPEHDKSIMGGIAPVGLVGNAVALDKNRDTVMTAQRLALLQGLLPEQDQLVVSEADQNRTAVAIDDDEDEDMETILERLPEDYRPLQECMAASQGCLLLLVLKQHLKDMYGLTDSKLHRYSPAEAAKVYEKSINRKQVPVFKPKVTLEALSQGTPPEVLCDEDKKNLVQQYLEFKELMLSIDRADDEDDEDDVVRPAPGKSPAQSKSPRLGATNEEGVTVVDGETPAGTTVVHTTNAPNSIDDRGKSHKRKYPISDVIKSKSKSRTPKLKEKPKKKVKKKRRRILDSEDDSDEGSDPDFMA